MKLIPYLQKAIWKKTKRNLPEAEKQALKVNKLQMMMIATSSNHFLMY